MSCLTAEEEGREHAGSVKDEEPVFGALIRRLREKRLWSHDALARVTGLSKGGLINIEKLDVPQVRGRTVHALAKAFGMSAEELMEEYQAAAVKEIGGSITVDGTPLPRELVATAAGAARADGTSLLDWVSRAITLRATASMSGGGVSKPRKIKGR